MANNKTRASVGLSYRHQSYRTFISIYHNEYTGEVKIQPKSATSSMGHNLDQDRHIRSGKLFVEGLTNKGKAKIQKAARVLERVHEHEPNLKAYCSMITLTYGKDYPEDHESKKHLNMFLKRLKRLHVNCKYVWVAEKQKRGAIHYHILTPYFTPKEWVNNAWNDIVSKWQDSSGHTQQTLLPNVIKVNSAGSYLAKYLSKEGHRIGGNGYNIDQQTRALMKDEAIHFEKETADLENVNSIVCSLIDKISLEDRKWFEWESNYTGYRGAWLSAINYFQLEEFLNYDRHEHGLMYEDETDRNALELVKIKKT